jgi:RNA polymerase-binding transcription factor DksA
MKQKAKSADKTKGKAVAKSAPKKVKAAEKPKAAKAAPAKVATKPKAAPKVAAKAPAKVAKKALAPAKKAAPKAKAAAPAKPPKKVAPAKKAAPAKAVKPVKAAAAPAAKTAKAAKATKPAKPPKATAKTPVKAAAKPEKKSAVVVAKPEPKGAVKVEPKATKAPSKVEAKPVVAAKAPEVKPGKVEKKVPAPEPIEEVRAKKNKKVVSHDDSNTLRSQHLKKLLALREKTHKIKKEAEGAPTVVKPAPAAAAAPKKIRKAPYTKGELADLKKVLETEREKLLSDLRQLDDLADSNRQTTHATFSSHQADAASDSSALESTYLQRRHEEEQFQMVSEALIKVEKGTYGLCELCIDEQQNLCQTCPFIPIERLQAKPFARMCVQLRTIMEKKNRR